jgi:hypothetical protein
LADCGPALAAGPMMARRERLREVLLDQGENAIAMG